MNSKLARPFQLLAQLLVISCSTGSKNKADAPKNEVRPAVHKALAYSLLATHDGALSKAKVDNRIFVGGSLSLANTTLGTAVVLQNQNSCLVQAAGGLLATNTEVRAGTICVKNLSLVDAGNLNSSIRESMDENLGEITTAQEQVIGKLQEGRSIQNAIWQRTNDTLLLTAKPGELRLNTELKSNMLTGVFKIDLAAPVLSLVIKIDAASLDFDSVTFSANYLPAKTLVIAPQATEIRITKSLFRGTLYAPHANVTVSDSRFEGSLFAKAFTISSEILWAPLDFGIPL